MVYAVITWGNSGLWWVVSMLVVVLLGGSFCVCSFGRLVMLRICSVGRVGLVFFFGMPSFCVRMLVMCGMCL